MLFAFFGKLLETLAQFGWGRWLLLKFPQVFSYGLFSREGPTKQQMDGTRFEMKFVGQGFSQGSKARQNFIWLLSVTITALQCLVYELSLCGRIISIPDILSLGAQCCIHVL